MEMIIVFPKITAIHSAPTTEMSTVGPVMATVLNSNMAHGGTKIVHELI